MLDIVYGTAGTHLYNGIYKLGITRKLELLFLLRDRDFSSFDRDCTWESLAVHGGNTHCRHS